MATKLLQDVASFHASTTGLPIIRGHQGETQKFSQVHWLLDDAPIIFRRADLHRSNIMVPRDPYDTLKASGLIDWH